MRERIMRSLWGFVGLVAVALIMWQLVSSVITALPPLPLSVGIPQQYVIPPMRLIVETKE